MSLQATPVTAAGNGYYFALATDPGLGQTLSLTGDTLAISGGNSVNVANATTVSTSKVKLTAQTYIAGFNTTNFTGDVRSEGRVISAPPLGLGTATLNGSLANVTVSGIGGNNPSVLFQKSVDSASIVYDGTDISISSLKTSTILGEYLTLKGAVPSISFKDTADNVRAFIDYNEANNQLYLNADIGPIAAEAAAYGGRVILDAAGATLSSTDRPTLLQRSQTSVGIKTIATLEDNGVFQVGLAGIGTSPSINFLDTTGAIATIAVNTAFAGSAMSITAPANITLSTSSVLLDGLTTYNTGAGVQATVNADVNNLDEVLTNNAYVPMTNYASGIAFTINPTQTIAFDTNSMPGGQLFRWRYSGQFGPSGLGGRSRYCGALRFQVDVNIASRSWDIPDTIIWWVELNDTINGQVYQAQDFGTSGDRYGYITTSQINPTNSEICHSVSFSSIFDLDTSVTGQPTPDDGDDCYFTVYGWGNTTSTTGRANVSVSIRPMRNLV
jgi:hypothetical protein